MSRLLLDNNSVDLPLLGAISDSSPQKHCIPGSTECQSHENDNDSDTDEDDHDIVNTKHRKHRGVLAAVLTLVVFSLHNGWNCFVFLNFVNYKPAREMLNTTDSEIGLINTMGWVGILCGTPVVTLWPQSYARLLLFIAGSLNCGAPVMRYFGAMAGSGDVMVATQFLQGAAFGVIGAWPAMLARLQWPKRRRTLVTAIASLSNYVGGALGTLLMPTIASTAPELLHVLWIQTYVAAGLFVAMVSWFWIPPVVDVDVVVSKTPQKYLVHQNHQTEAADKDAPSIPPNPTPTNNLTTPSSTSAQIGLLAELKLCIKGVAGVQVLTFGIAVGVSLLLQGMNQFLLSEFGFTDIEAGFGNAAYQLAAAVVGVGLGGRVTQPRHLRVVIRGLHVVAAISSIGLAVVCWSSRTYGRYHGDVSIMVTVMALLGASLMGMLPFLLQQAVETVAPAPENVVSGLIYLVAMAIAASLTEVTSTIEPVTSMIVISGLLSFEMMLFALFDPQSRFCCR
eukprot:m.102639 g.102639  ORF g.102639 m.102639 type:complete len:507 (+) comp27425_c0_seq1:377-1897(+)